MTCWDSYNFGYLNLPPSRTAGEVATVKWNVGSHLVVWNKQSGWSKWDANGCSVSPLLAINGTTPCSFDPVYNEVVVGKSSYRGYNHFYFLITLYHHFAN